MRSKTNILLVILLLANFMQLVCIKAAQAQTQTFSSPGCRYGMNAEAPSYTEYAYVDVLTEGHWGGGPSFNSAGYPTSGSPQFFFSLFGDPPGQQVYTFYGEGIYDIGPNGSFQVGFVPGTLQHRTNDQGVVITTFQFIYNIPTPAPTTWFGVAQGIPLSWLNINHINPTGDPKNWPNNFHLIRPGYPAWQEGDSCFPVTATSYPIFTNEYLKSFAPFCCIRFMDWMNTNWNLTPFSWANRPMLNFGSTLSNRATAYEYMIALCNATNCDMWINVPVQATNDWKVGFANLVANDPVYHLNSNLHVYYEHGNELWNWGFPAWQWVNTQAIADGFGAGWSGHGMEVAKLLMSDVDVMQSILGPLGRPILSGQFGGSSYTSGAGLQWISQNYGFPGKYIYGIAGAPYFSTVDQTEITGSLASQMNDNMKIANANGVHMCAYESGTGLGGGSDVNGYLANLAIEESPAMAAQYAAFGQMWQANGGDLCNFFTNSGVWSKGGFWAYLPVGSYINHLDDPVCTKYNACAALAAVCNCGNAPLTSSVTSTSGSGSSSSSGAGSGSASGSNSGSNSGSGSNASSGSGQSGSGANGAGSAGSGNASNQSPFLHMNNLGGKPVSN